MEDQFRRTRFRNDGLNMLVHQSKMALNSSYEKQKANYQTIKLVQQYTYTPFNPQVAGMSPLRSSTVVYSDTAENLQQTPAMTKWAGLKTNSEQAASFLNSKSKINHRFAVRRHSSMENIETANRTTYSNSFT